MATCLLVSRSKAFVIWAEAESLHLEFISTFHLHKCDRLWRVLTGYRERECWVLLGVWEVCWLSITWTYALKFKWEAPPRLIGHYSGGIAFLGQLVILLLFLFCCTLNGECFLKVLSHSVVSDSWPHGLYPARLLCLWDFSGKNTGVGFYFLLWEILLDRRLNPRLLHWQVDSLPLSHLGSLFPKLPSSVPFHDSFWFLCLSGHRPFARAIEQLSVPVLWRSSSVGATLIP